MAISPKHQSILEGVIQGLKTRLQRLNEIAALTPTHQDELAKTANYLHSAARHIENVIIEMQKGDE